MRTRNRYLLHISLSFLAVAAIAACSDDLSPVAPPTTDDSPVATTITVAIDTIDYGSAATPTIVVKDQNGLPISGSLSDHLSIESSDTTVARVDMDAMSIIGAGPGEATLTVSYDSIQTEAAVAVRLGFAPASRIAAGSHHSCVLDAAGVARCWGDGDEGMLGDGNAESSATPVFVAGGHIFSSIVAGNDHTCAIDTDGAAWCWGDSGAGQIGDGDVEAEQVNAPVAVAGGLHFARITAGDDHTCGLVADGTAYCWGENGSGQLGIDASDDEYYVPQQVAGGVRFVRLSAAGERTCALDELGRAYCWGYGGYGALGTGDSDDQRAPAAAAAGKFFVDIAGGELHTCAIDGQGRAFCWGNNEDGEGGNGLPSEQENSPVQVQLDAHLTSISHGQNGHLCAVDGTTTALYCWGQNGNGQLGDATTNDANIPVLTHNIHAKEAAAGGSHTCALNVNDDVYCWGSNEDGEVGNGLTDGENVLVPAVIVAPDDTPPGCMTLPRASTSRGCMIRGIDAR
jgi:alpha-tubulin suppressor-like RCC1 family protein